MFGLQTCVAVCSIWSRRVCVKGTMRRAQSLFMGAMMALSGSRSMCVGAEAENNAIVEDAQWYNEIDVLRKWGQC